MNQQEYKQDIESLKALSREGELSPLRHEVLKAQLMSRLNAQAEGATSLPARFLWAPRRTSLAYAVVPAFLVFMLMGGTVFASYGALPGETLYPVKRLTEQVEFTLAVSEQAKVEVQAKHVEKRLEEIIKLDQKAEVQTVPEDKVKVEERREEAKVEARTELETALNTLTEVQVKLETKGNDKAATNIQNVIQNLKDKATPTFKVEVESEDHGRVKVRFPSLPSRYDRWNRDRGNDQEKQPDDTGEENKQNNAPRNGSTNWFNWGERNREAQPNNDGSAGANDNPPSTVEEPDAPAPEDESEPILEGEVEGETDVRTDIWWWGGRNSDRRGSGQGED